MTNFIPLFPLKIVVYPGETLNLHIFEPRYVQMVRECMEQQKPFGLPPVVVDSDVPTDLGTLMEITDLATEHPDGTLDIRTRGKAVFRILQPVADIPDKLYSGAIVTYPENVMGNGDSRLFQNIVAEVKRLYELLNVAEKFPTDEKMLAYEIAHFVGFSVQQEYELLGLFTELHRLEYIRRHLNNIVPVIKELEEMKERIQRNGHFRNLSLN